MNLEKNLCVIINIHENYNGTASKLPSFSVNYFILGASNTQYPHTETNTPEPRNKTNKQIMNKKNKQINNLTNLNMSTKVFTQTI